MTRSQGAGQDVERGLALRFPQVTVVVVVLATLGLAYAARSVRFDGSPAPLLLDGSRRERARAASALGDLRTVVVTVFAEDVFRPTTLAKIDGLSSSFWHLDGVSTVTSPTTLLRAEAAGGRLRFAPLLGSLPESEDEAARVRAAVLAHPLAVGNVVSADGRVARIKLRLASTATAPARRVQLVEQIRELARGAGGPETFAIGGTASLAARIPEALRGQLTFTTAAALAVAAVVALVALRSPMGTLLVAFVAFAGVVWTLGAMALLDQAVDLCTVAVPPILALIGAAAPMVIVTCQRRACARGRDPGAAAAATMALLRSRLTLAALLTIVGAAAFAYAACAPRAAFSSSAWSRCWSYR
jgi:predicted RND superfamily exporter protein